MKPVAAVPTIPGELRNEDAVALAAGNVQLPWEFLNPFCFAQRDVTPHCRAPAQKPSISDNIEKFQIDFSLSDLIAVEGARGWWAHGEPPAPETVDPTMSEVAWRSACPCAGRRHPPRH